MRGIFITGLCQSAGIASGLKSILRAALPDTNLTVDTSPPALSPFASAQEQDDALSRVAEKADFILTTSHAPFVNRRDGERFNVKIIRYPIIRFSAFHPDLVYAQKVGSATRLEGYHSALTLWGYANGVDPADIVTAFNDDVYAAAGYYDLWSESVADLQTEFQGCGFPFREFLLSIKRQGLFMHSLDHPKPDVLATLAQHIARKLGIAEQFLSEVPYVDDFLSTANWPVYPEIAQSFLCQGSYQWRIDGRMMNLREYVDVMYSRYAGMALRGAEYTTTHSQCVRARLECHLTKLMRQD